MKKKELILTLIYLISSSKTNSDWEVDQIHSLIPQPENFSNITIDPNNYLNADTKKKINSEMELINSSKKIKNLLIIINSISRNYWSKIARKKDIIKFSELLIFKIYKDKKQRDNTILTIYSIEDHIYRIRTGKIARKFISDSETNHLAENIKRDLQARNFDFAFGDLFRNMELCTLDKDKSVCNESIWPLFIIFMMICLFFSVFCILNFFQVLKDKKRERIQKDLKKKFKTIKEIKKSGLDIHLYIQQNCVICLETLDQENRNKSENDPFREIILKCGHNFHQNCINSWQMRQSNCPICRLKIEYVSNEDFIGNKNIEEPFVNHGNSNYRNNTLDLMLFEIQRERYEREFNNNEMSDMYNNDKWSWVNYNTAYNNNNNNWGGGNSGGFSFDNDCGGTSGGW